LNKEVLVISVDAIPGGSHLAAGPGIRYYQIARSLALDYGFEVTLAVPQACYEPLYLPFAVVSWDLGEIAQMANQFKVVILPHVHSALATTYSRLVKPTVPTVVDLYDPVLIENLAFQPVNQAGVRDFANFLTGVLPLLRRGDFFVCANERQYYYYLGVLNALGRINPLTFHYQLLDLVPFGVEPEPPQHTKQVMRGVFVGPNDPVILWFSGIYPWFDAVTLVKAMPEVLKAIPSCKLVVMGGVHPRGHAPDYEFKATVNEAEKSGLINKAVFFVDWQPFADRANWYLEANLAVTTYKNSLETVLSHRTRVIDFLWAGLPVITTEGDAVAELLKTNRCGLTVPPGDHKALAAKIITVLSSPNLQKEFAQNAKKLAQTELTWKKVIKPLAEFCLQPKRAPDVADIFTQQTLLKEAAALNKLEQSTLTLRQKVKNVYASEGIKGLVKRLLNLS